MHEPKWLHDNLNRWSQMRAVSPMNIIISLLMIYFSNGLTSEDDLMDETVIVFLAFPFEILMGSMIWCWQCAGAITRPTGKSRWLFKSFDSCGGDNNCNADICWMKSIRSVYLFMLTDNGIVYFDMFGGLVWQVHCLVLRYQLSSLTVGRCLVWPPVV